MPRPIHATIDPAAYAYNLRLAKTYAQGAFTWAVMKADAYGHGIARLYAGLVDANADGVAVLDLAEAQLLRNLGWKKPILLLEGVFSTEDVSVCVRLGLTTVLHHFEQFLMCREALQNSSKLGNLNKLDNSGTLDVFIKFNTGMNRLGFPCSTAAQVQHSLSLIQQGLAAAPYLRVTQWITHLANADVTNADVTNADAPNGAVQPNIQQQINRFEAMLLALRTAMPQYASVPAGLSNSAATLRSTEIPVHLRHSVRAGIMGYGVNPLNNATTADLEPVMHLHSEIIAVQRLSAGDAVGYGGTFIAERSMRIGIVACGYADGYPRHCGTGTPIAVDGVLTQVLGRVSMDMLCVDLSDNAQADLGSVVELWGNFVHINTVAAAGSTIAYELMCALAARVPITVIDDQNMSESTGKNIVGNKNGLHHGN